MFELLAISDSFFRFRGFLFYREREIWEGEEKRRKPAFVPRRISVSGLRFLAKLRRASCAVPVEWSPEYDSEWTMV